jgi:predicted MPP superfamily phosphohydrolase
MASAAVQAVLIGSTALDLFVAAGLLLVESRPAVSGGVRRLDLGRVAGAVVGTTLVFGIKAAVLSASGLDTFGLIHLIYLGLVVVVPLVGAGVLAAAWRGCCELTRPVRVLAVGALALAAVGGYASFIEPYRLRVEQARVPVRRWGPGPAIRLGVLADLQTDHIGAYERRAVASLVAQKPDVILIPGDLFQAHYRVLEREWEPIRALLRDLKAPGGVFLVPGDVDPPLETLRELVAGTGVRLLVNDWAEVELAGRRLAIGGVELAFVSPGARELVDRLGREPDPGAARILVAHRPDVALGLTPGDGIDLVVSGHTHGGQVVVPGFGPLMTLSSVPRAVAAGGLHELDAQRLYVSRGVGFERGQAPPLRFWCPPEISILELTAP